MSTFTGWALDPAQRDGLLLRFPARYATVVADHVTLKFRPDHPKLPTETSGLIVGEADDNSGVQALIVSIGGSTRRPDGSTYHITWSLGPGRRAKESNDVIRDRGWRRLSRSVPIALEPRLFGP